MGLLISVYQIMHALWHENPGKHRTCFHLFFGGNSSFWKRDLILQFRFSNMRGWFQFLLMTC